MHLGILASHPIQYQAPWFRALAKEVDLEVFFAHRQSAAEQGKAGFGVAFEWDVDLLAGYQHHFLRNVAAHPNVGAYAGCDTPEIAGIISGNSNSETRNTKPFDAFIVCGWYLKSYLQAVRACRAAGVPVLVRGDSQLRTPRPFLKRMAMEIRQRWLLRKFDGFLSVGQRHREYLEHFGVPTEKIFQVPHFVDNEWFATRAAEARPRRAEIRRQWGATEADVVALFVGKFIPKKRPMDLLRAISALNVDRPAFSILAVLVGAGELEDELRDFAAREKLRVGFPGFKNQSEMPAIYGAADVLVLPSESETWGLVVNEAMACGLPAIVSDAVGCGPDLMEAGVTGFSYPVGDAAELAERLRTTAQLKRRGHDFASAVAERLKAYSPAAAVFGALRAVREVVNRNHG